MTAGTAVRVTTTNGAVVEGELLYDSELFLGSYGGRAPILRTPDGWTFNYRYSIATAPDGRDFSPIPGAERMERQS